VDEDSIVLTEEQIEAIAELAATKAINKMETQLYTTVGKSVLSKLAYLVGIVTVALYFWLQSKGLMK